MIRHPHHFRLTYDASNNTRVSIVDAGTVDEFVMDDWLHLELMHKSGRGQTWFLQVGDAHISVSIDRKGRATVHIQRGEFGETRGETRV